jgi:tRNA-modifying protein YgfZ
MKPEWRSFLSDAGAELDDGAVASFGNPEREKRMVTNGDVLCDLSHWGLIGVRGDDALKFLHSQLSSDVTQVSETHSQLSSYCSPRGRMLACFRVFRRSDTFFLRLPAVMLEPTLKRLRLYVLRARAKLEDANNALIRCGYSGPNAKAELKRALGTCPDHVDACVGANDITVIHVPGPHSRFELYGNLTAMQELWSVLNVRAAPVGASPWALLDILSGIPNIFPATSDRFVPQMVNLHLLGGISFKKGCYPGQEVVARMHHLGKLKRRMYRVHLAGDRLPEPGDEIFAAGKNTTEPSGMVVDAQPHSDDGVEALAVLRLEDTQDTHLRLWNMDGPPLALRDLPFGLD